MWLMIGEALCITTNAVVTAYREDKREHQLIMRLPQTDLLTGKRINYNTSLPGECRRCLE